MNRHLLRPVSLALICSLPLQRIRINQLGQHYCLLALATVP